MLAGSSHIVLICRCLHVQGKVPPMNELVALHNLISQAGDLHQPVQLEKQLTSGVRMASSRGKPARAFKGKLNNIY